MYFILFVFLYICGCFCLIFFYFDWGCVFDVIDLEEDEVIVNGYVNGYGYVYLFEVLIGLYDDGIGYVFVVNVVFNE